MAPVENVIVAFGGNSEPELVSVLRTCERANVETFIVPRFFELGVEMDDQVWGIPMNRLRSSGPRRSTWAVKRLVDVALSAIALVVLTPMLLAIEIAACLIVGILLTVAGAVYPARQAARMQPIEAMRVET